MTAKQISDLIIKRIDDDSGAPGSVSADHTVGNVPPEVLAAINEGQELFALLSLCLERTTSITLAASTSCFTIRGTLPDFICPLRLMIDGTRVRPGTLAEFDAENETWQSTAGTPTSYFSLGFNFFGLNLQPIGDTSADLTHAYSPLQLVRDAFPEIPEHYHQALADYGVYRIRLKEGGQGLERGVRYLNSFLDAAQACGDYVRARSRAARYDVLPFELQLFDRSRLIEALIKKGKPNAH